MLLVGAGLTLIMRSSGAEANQARDHELLLDLKTKIESLYENGPPGINARVNALENRTIILEKKIDDIYTVVVLRQSPK